MPSKSPLDLVTLVNKKDEVIGTMDKIAAHRGEGKLHRAISVYLFNQKAELLIQQRSHKKIVGAGQWANTVCGNVRPNETYQQCAYRRLAEELGIESQNAKIEPIYKFQYQVQCNKDFSENEIDQVYLGFYEGELNLNPNEVQKTIWVSWQKLLNREIDLELAPWFEVMIGDKKLLSKINIK